MFQAAAFHNCFVSVASTRMKNNENISLFYINGEIQIQIFHAVSESYLGREKNEPHEREKKRNDENTHTIV